MSLPPLFEEARMADPPAVISNSSVSGARSTLMVNSRFKIGVAATRPRAWGILYGESGGPTAVASAYDIHNPQSASTLEKISMLCEAWSKPAAASSRFQWHDIQGTYQSTYLTGNFGSSQTNIGSVGVIWDGGCNPPRHLRSPSTHSGVCGIGRRLRRTRHSAIRAVGLIALLTCIA